MVAKKLRLRFHAQYGERPDMQAEITKDTSTVPFDQLDS